MSLTPDERAALARLDREVSGDPDVDDALRSFDVRPGEAQAELGAVAVVGAVALLALGLTAVVAFLAVSFVISFIGFVVLVVGVEMAVASARWQRAGERLARLARSVAQSSPEP